MKPFLDQKQMNQLVQAVVMSSLDYCNALYFGCSKATMKQLQSIQNRACAIVLGLKKKEPRHNHLKSLHWLKVQERVEFKILLLTYKTLTGSAPSYLTELLQYNNLSGSRTLSLKSNVSHTSWGDRAFIPFGLRVGNIVLCTF